MIEEELKENIVIPIRKEQIKWCNPIFMIKKANGKWRGILDAKALNQQIADFHFKMHDSNQVKQTIRPGDWCTSLDLSSAFLHLIDQTESQPYLAFEIQNNHYTYRAMPFGTKHSPIYFATSMEPIIQQIRMKTEIRIINYVDDTFLLHMNKEYLRNVTQKDRDKTESNSDILRMGMESSKRNSQNEDEEALTFPTRFIQYEMMDKDRNGDKNEVNLKINRKTKLLKTTILRSLTLSELNVQSQCTISKVERMEYNDGNEQYSYFNFNLMDSKTLNELSSIINSNISSNIKNNSHITQYLRFNIGVRVRNDINCSCNLKQEMCEINKQQQENQNYNLKSKKFIKNLKKFANVIPGDQKRQQYSSFRHLEIESNISIEKGYKICKSNIKKPGIQFLINHLSGVKNELANAQCRLSMAGDYKLKEKIFLQTYLQMNFNLTIDLFSQHFNNLLPRFMSTIRGLGQTAIDALNQAFKKELPYIHSPIPLLSPILQKIREKLIETVIIAPIRPGQIRYTELVNMNLHSFMLDQSNKILKLGILLIKMNLKLPPGKISCFLMDRSPGKEENAQETFYEFQTYPMKQQI
ncbi:MAG: hypothetical protein EZS28_031608 [Streblomastix strix]|uniref:Reverse transcriptase domain-containing protein n=1 Tax=Streblomastix strix TaxID=222440 RepID=A0A5J4UQ97_9EUKA|nr:MAG: hypothetical protein EZS28_031608 [Streblomastix strix]